ncbi:MAG: hypothetical protein AB7I19_06160 [Planctomycetota bacterium]
MERSRRERNPRRAAAALKLVLAALLLPAIAWTQSARLVAEIAPLDSRSLPPGLRWLRATLLEHGDRGIEANAGLRLQLGRDGGLSLSASKTIDLGDDAMRFTLELDGEAQVRGACDRRGHETWWIDPELDLEKLPTELRRLVERFGYEAATGWLTASLDAIVGNLATAILEGDPSSEALMMGAAECGTVALLARRTKDGTLRVDGSSDGGLLLPTVLVLLADRQSGDDGEVPPKAITADVERWILMAASARADEQEEAARQLGRFQEPRAIATLERLLHGDADLRLTAMHSLVRLRSTTSIAAIAAAADPKIGGSVEFAARAIWSLLPPPLTAAMHAEAAHVVEPTPREPSLSPLQWELPHAVAALSGALAVVCLFALAGLHRRNGARRITPNRAPA